MSITMKEIKWRRTSLGFDSSILQSHADIDGKQKATEMNTLYHTVIFWRLIDQTWLVIQRFIDGCNGA